MASIQTDTFDRAVLYALQPKQMHQGTVPYDEVQRRRRRNRAARKTRQQQRRGA